MRSLLVAAAAILFLSAAQAQEMVPARPATPAAQETNDRAMPAQTSSSTLIDQLKAAGELKDTKTLEAPAPRLDPVQAEAKPTASKPVEEKSIEVLPAQAKSTETPVVANPAETKPAVTPPVAATTTAAKPAEAKPAETKPVQTATETRPAKKKVVRKRETDEQKARRIAAKYGISW
jgi:outer membrane biosynthesis protein TonB